MFFRRQEGLDNSKLSLSFCRGSRVGGRGFHVEGEGTMSRVTKGNIFFSKIFFYGKGNNRCNQSLKQIRRI